MNTTQITSYTPQQEADDNTITQLTNRIDNRITVMLNLALRAHVLSATNPAPLSNASTEIRCCLRDVEELRVDIRNDIILTTKKLLTTAQRRE